MTKRAVEIHSIEILGWVAELVSFSGSEKLDIFVKKIRQNNTFLYLFKNEGYIDSNSIVDMGRNINVQQFIIILYI
jgi:hypothetical protein